MAVVLDNMQTALWTLARSPPGTTVGGYSQKCKNLFTNTVKPVYNGHPWDPKKVAVVQSWSVLQGFSIKIGIKSSLAKIRLAVVDMWPLLRGGR